MASEIEAAGIVDFREKNSKPSFKMTKSIADGTKRSGTYLKMMDRKNEIEKQRNRNT